MSILVLQHHDAFPPSLLLAEAQALGHKLRVFEVAEGEIPSRDLAGVSALILGAGPFAVSESAEYPWMRRELELCRLAVEADIPVIGIGFGARLLGVVLGGEERQTQHNGKAWAEIGWSDVRFTEEAIADGPFRGFPNRLEVLHFHALEVSLPPQAMALASTNICEVQAFSQDDKHFGVLFHMELIEKDIMGLTKVFSETLEAMGLTRLTLAMDLLRRLQHLELYASQFFGRILDRIDADEG